MSFSWGTKTEEEANAAKPSIDYVAGRYKFKTYEAIPKISQLKTSEDGVTTGGNNYINLKMYVFTPSGKLFSDVNIVDTPKMFFLRKHFWESVGFPEKVNAASEYYPNQEGEADFGVEEYYSKKYGEMRKKLVVIDFVSPTNLPQEPKNSNTAFEDDDIPF